MGDKSSEDKVNIALELFCNMLDLNKREKKLLTSIVKKIRSRLCKKNISQIINRLGWILKGIKISFISTLSEDDLLLIVINFITSGMALAIDKPKSVIIPDTKSYFMWRVEDLLMSILHERMEKGNLDPVVDHDFINLLLFSALKNSGELTKIEDDDELELWLNKKIDCLIQVSKAFKV